jgi:hypothetical protein
MIGVIGLQRCVFKRFPATMINHFSQRRGDATGVPLILKVTKMIGVITLRRCVVARFP